MAVEQELTNWKNRLGHINHWPGSNYHCRCHVKERAAINGHIRGDVRCASLIAPEVEGNVVAEDVVIRGRVIGSIRGDRWSEATCSTVRNPKP